MVRLLCVSHISSNGQMFWTQRSFGYIKQKIEDTLRSKLFMKRMTIGGYNLMIIVGDMYGSWASIPKQSILKRA